jgi:hypothetical protein
MENCARRIPNFWQRYPHPHRKIVACGCRQGNKVDGQREHEEVQHSIQTSYYALCRNKGKSKKQSIASSSPGDKDAAGFNRLGLQQAVMFDLRRELVDLLNEIGIPVVGGMKVLTPPFDLFIDVTSSATFHRHHSLRGLLILNRQEHVAGRLSL